MEPSTDTLAMNGIPSSGKDLRTSQSLEESACDPFLVQFDTGDPANPHVRYLYVRLFFVSP